MTDEITVSALDETLEFDGREALAEHVESFVSNRVYDPIELACIQRLAELGNGSTPPDVKRTARQNTFVSPDREDPEAARLESPFGDRIRELEAELAEREAEHEEAREALFAKREEVAAAERRGEIGEVERLSRELPGLVADEKSADRAAVRARAALHKAERAADRWRYDQDARFVVGDPDDRHVVDREGLHDWLDRRR